jgi:glyoxylase-like metal-dependent hydrolase (beta-lactamase superfamily II)
VSARPGLYFRQLLAGRDVARDDPAAVSMVNYVYAIGDPDSRRAVLVDPAWAPAELLDVLAGDGMSLAGVVLTHYHPDHAGGDFAGHHVAGVAELLELADVPVHVQAPELEWLALSAGLEPSVLSAHEPGDAVEFGGLRLELLRTPGHTPGSQCVLVDGRVVTGDTLFLNGCGRTDLPGGDAGALYESLTRLAALPPETEVFAGHAYDPAPSAQIGELRRRNPVLVPRTAEEWRRRFA